MLAEPMVFLMHKLFLKYIKAYTNTHFFKVTVFLKLPVKKGTHQYSQHRFV